MREVAHLLVKHWGQGSVVEAEEPGAPHEAHYLRLDSSKAGAELGWRAMLTPEERMQWTVEWYKAHGDGAAMDTWCERQIDEYCRHDAD